MDLIIKWIKTMSYLFSVEKCFCDREKEGNSCMGLCNGLQGGDKNTSYLQYQCVTCKYFVGNN